MKKILKITLISILGGCFIGYLMLCATVALFPELFLYHPNQQISILLKAHADELPFQEVTYKAADKTKLSAWFIPAEDNHKTIVFMHGNADNVETFYPKMKVFAEQGYGILMPEYRGFGGLKGKITQKNLEKDALAAVDYLEDLGYQNQDIYLYGMSLGSHMAVHTAAYRQNKGVFAGIILEVPFDNILNAAESKGYFLPLNKLIKDKYDNITDIKKIKCPILIMGAKMDKTVPVKLAENLYKAAPEPKKFILYDKAGHTNLQQFHNDLDILQWIETNEKNI